MYSDPRPYKNIHPTRTHGHFHAHACPHRQPPKAPACPAIECRRHGANFAQHTMQPQEDFTRKPRSNHSQRHPGSRMFLKRGVRREADASISKVYVTACARHWEPHGTSRCVQILSGIQGVSHRSPNGRDVLMGQCKTDSNRRGMAEDVLEEEGLGDGPPPELEAGKVGGAVSPCHARICSWTS